MRGERARPVPGKKKNCAAREEEKVIRDVRDNYTRKKEMEKEVYSHAP